MAAPCSEYELYFPDTTKYNECIAGIRLDSVVRNIAAYTAPTEEQVKAATAAYFPPESPMYEMAPTPQQTIGAVNVHQESIGTPFRSVMQMPQAGQGSGSSMWWLVLAAIVAGSAAILYVKRGG
jgi:hypothetical protein